MKALTITARLETPMMLPEGFLHLDSLLAAAIARRDNLPPADKPEEVEPIEIPVERHHSGRFHLASVSIYEREEVSKKHIIKRFPIREAQAFARDDQRKINTGRGSQKNYRIPEQAIWPTDGEVVFYAVGDPEKIRPLLIMTTHLGKKRAAGMGSVARWEVEPGMPDHGPILDEDDRPLRNIPVDEQSVDVNPGAVVELTPATYPYWLATEREKCFVPRIPR